MSDEPEITLNIDGDELSKESQLSLKEYEALLVKVIQNKITGDEVLSTEMKTQNEVKGLKLTPLAPVVSEDYSIVYILGSDNERAGQAYFDRESNELTVYVPDGVTVKEIKAKKVAAYLVRDLLVMPLAQVAIYDIDPSQLRTCQYFTAADDSLNSSPVVAADEHSFDRGFSYSSCSHPNAAPSAPCVVEQAQNSCGIFLSEKWKDVKAYEGSGDRVALQSTRKNIGFVHYRIIKINDVQGTQAILENLPSSGESLEEDKLAAIKTLDGIVEPWKDLVSVPVENESSIKVKYYDYALST